MNTTYNILDKSDWLSYFINPVNFVRHFLHLSNLFIIENKL